eukprot:2647912-Amphidinium_carterae.1
MEIQKEHTTISVKRNTFYKRNAIDNPFRSSRPKPTKTKLMGKHTQGETKYLGYCFEQGEPPKKQKFEKTIQTQ